MTRTHILARDLCAPMRPCCLDDEWYAPRPWEIYKPLPEGIDRAWIDPDGKRLILAGTGHLIYSCWGSPSDVVEQEHLPQIQAKFAGPRRWKWRRHGMETAERKGVQRWCLIPLFDDDDRRGRP